MPAEAAALVASPLAPVRAAERSGPSCLDTCATTAGKPRGLLRRYGDKACNPLLQRYLDRDPELGRWSYHRDQADRLARRLDAGGRPELAARLGACSELLLFGPGGKLLGPHYRCSARVCPICQAHRATQWGHRAREVTAELAERPAQWALLTLTVRNVPIDHIAEAIRDLHRAVKRLTLRREFAARGWIRQTEITVNASQQTAHPHCHLLLELPADYYDAPLEYSTPGRQGGRPKVLRAGYMTQKRLRRLWAECARLDYDPWVDIRAVQMRHPDERSRALLEVCKYGIKPAELAAIAPRALAALTDQLRGHRTFGIGGSLRAPFAAHRRREQAERALERILSAGHAPATETTPLQLRNQGPAAPPRRLAVVALWNAATRSYTRHSAPIPTAARELATHETVPQPRRLPWLPDRFPRRGERMERDRLIAALDELANRGDAWEPPPAPIAPVSADLEDDLELIHRQARRAAPRTTTTSWYTPPPRGDG